MVSSALLPEPVRQRVVALAAETVGRIPAAEVPSTLRAVARFTPVKRGKLGGPALAAAVERDAVFRLQVAETLTERQPELAAAVGEGLTPPAAEPVDLAVAAYLLRPEDWPQRLDAVRRILEEEERRRLADGQEARVAALREEVARVEAQWRERLRRAEEVAAEQRQAADDLRRQLRRLGGELRATERGRAEAEQALAQARHQEEVAESERQAELRRMRQRLLEVEEALEVSRRSDRSARAVDDARLWLLLETITGAAQGLRRELAVAPTEQRPGDLLVQTQRGAGDGAAPRVRPRGDDLALLDHLLELPKLHLIVDGYNVSKTGYPSLPLATQRSRLTKGLANLAARTGAEVTCVYDGAERPPVMPPSPRGVRVIFSAPGETADEVIRRLVSAEPEGRLVAVVSSDREVAERARRSGGYAVASPVLLTRLTRG